jgi:8-oxo-dGTP pyrophosphatase MutT (NUDIX family)/predicted nucleotidyltransferase
MEFDARDRIKKINGIFYHESAGGFLFFQEDKTGELFVALLKNSKDEIVVPKGHIRENENPEETAERELIEELSLKDKPNLIDRVGVSRYTFQDKDKLHRKKVYLYVFELGHKAKINPLKSEFFTSAKWVSFPIALKKITHDQDYLMAAKKIFYRKKKKDKQQPPTKFVHEVIKDFKKALSKNLFALILVGSVARRSYRKGWSDIDLIVVIKKMTIEAKYIVATLKTKNEKRFKTHLGINLITEGEVLRPNFPLDSLDGKVLQGLLELKKYPERLLYINTGSKRSFYTPSKKEIKEYSLANVGMFFRKNRKDLISGAPISGQKARETLKREIKASLTMVKLALQCFDQYSLDAPLLMQVEKSFPDYDFGLFKFILRIVDSWDAKSKKEISGAIKKADAFIESFSSYIFNKLKHGR